MIDLTCATASKEHFNLQQVEDNKATSAITFPTRIMFLYLKDEIVVESSNWWMM
jgi:hypothetical protein